MNDQQLQSTPVSTNRLEERRGNSRTPLMLTAWVWHAESTSEGTPVRLLDHSAEGVGFIAPAALTKGEFIELSLDHAGAQRTRLQVANCEFIGDNAYRIGAFTTPTDPI